MLLSLDLLSYASRCALHALAAKWASQAVQHRPYRPWVPYRIPVSRPRTFDHLLLKNDVKQHYHAPRPNFHRSESMDEPSERAPSKRLGSRPKRQRLYTCKCTPIHNRRERRTVSKQWLDCINALRLGLEDTQHSHVEKRNARQMLSCIEDITLAA